MGEQIKKFEYIFIDLDGPILEGKYRHYKCYKDIVEAYGGNPVDIGDYWQLKRKIIKRNILLEKSNFKGTYDEFLNTWLENIEKKEYLKYDILKPKVVATLQNFRNHGDRIYIVTMRNNSDNLMIQLEELGIRGLFDKLLVCSNKVKNPKFIALKEIKFNSAIMIGDTEEDTLTAKRLGIKCIGITNGLREKNVLNADYYIDEICNIDFNKIMNK